MRKLFKKSLACCLALALCFTLFAGAISANALTTNPAYSTEDVTVAPGESTTIKFTIKDFAEIQGVILKVYVPSVVASIDAVTVDGIDLVEWSDETGEGNYQVDKENKFIKFITLANFEGVDTVDALTFDIKVTVDAEAEAGEYGYTAPVIQATDGDVLVTINGEFGKFTVVEKEPEVPVEPEVDETIKIRHSVAFESCVEINYKVATNLLAGCTDIYAVFDYITFNSVEMVPDQLVVRPEIWGSDYVFTYNRTPVAEIGCVIDCVVYATKADGTKIKSVLDQYSVKQFAMSQLRKETRNPKLEKLLVDLLRYAAAVQVQFGVLTDDLVTKDLTPEMEARGTDLNSNLVVLNESKETPIESPLVTFNKALELESSTFLKFLMTMDSSIDVNSLTLHIEYKDMYGNLHPYDIAGSDFDRELTNKKRPFYSFGKIAPADMRSECTVYVMQDGKQVSNTLVYGIESFCSNKMSGNALSTVFGAMFRYSDSAKEHFTR